MRVLGAATLLAALTTVAQAAELRITIEAPLALGGVVMIGLYDSEQSFRRAIELSDKDGFLSDPDRVAGLALRPIALGLGAEVSVPPGRYAAIVFHDLNGNGRLDTNFWGVPTEPYGFSNNVRPALAPPSFAEAAFAVEQVGRTIAIRMRFHEDGRTARQLDSNDHP